MINRQTATIGVIAIVLGLLGYGGIAAYNSLQNAEIYYGDYDDLTNWVTFYKELKPDIKEAMEDNVVTEGEFSTIKQKYNAIKDREHQKRMSNANQAAKLKLLAALNRTEVADIKWFGPEHFN